MRPSSLRRWPVDSVAPVDGPECAYGIDDELVMASKAKKESDNVVEVGMTAESRDLYREDPRQAWEEWAPEDIGLHATSKNASEGFALIVRREKRNGDSGEPVLALHSVKVQSPLIKARLHSVFEGYKGINTNLNKLEFSAPFREFFYRWSEFVRAAPDELEAEADRKHFQLLFKTMQTEIMPHLEQAGDYLKNNVISFGYLWTLFEPGTEIYSKVDGQHRLYLLNGGQYTEVCGMKVYTLSCRYIDTDGEKFGCADASLVIPQFADVKPITELNVLPSNLQPGIEEIRLALRERGRRFERLQGVHFKAYSGTYIIRSPPVGMMPSQYSEGGRAMLDCSSYLRHNGQQNYSLEPLNSLQGSGHLGIIWPFGSDEKGEEEIDMPKPLRVMKEMARLARRQFSGGNTNGHENKCLSEHHFLFCNPMVRGYCFKTKRWAQFYVDGVQDIEWNETAFTQLVLPHDYKAIVWAFVDAQLSRKTDFDDIVKDKGKGIIMLLSGEPGTGKTLTSESVAEAMKKPLYSMSAGELGLSADEVEQNLGRVLELCKKWCAVLLLDECDVFLEKRSASDLHRNKLVSVFLRLLEYYQGVMFLTTNRMESFDPAFESRIDLILHYPRLDIESRRHVWRTFTQPGSPTSNIGEDDLEQLARSEFNGRQIKNIVKTGRLLAARDDAALSMKHLEIVLRVKGGGPTVLGKEQTNGAYVD